MFSFGLGDDCDHDLVKGIAREGRGTYTLVGDDQEDLSGPVISALAQAMQPSLSDFHYKWFATAESTPVEEISEESRRRRGRRERRRRCNKRRNHSFTSLESCTDTEDEDDFEQTEIFRNQLF